MKHELMDGTTMAGTQSQKRRRKDTEIGMWACAYTDTVLCMNIAFHSFFKRSDTELNFFWCN